MEQQTSLFQHTGISKPVITLQKNKHYLEQEKEKFINNMCDFIKPLNLQQLQIRGRPKSNFKDIIKSLLVMSFHGMSYRRSQSDFKYMKEKELIKSVIPRSTLNDYSNNENTKLIIEKLIQISSLFFQENEDTLILDSTWFGERMYSGGYRKVYDKKNAPLQKVRKLHVACLKNSKVITYAKATIGTKHDCPMFKDLVLTTKKNRFQIKTLLADAGYSSKENYALCRENNIFNVFIDFKKNASVKRAKSDIWREKLKLYKENKEIWNQTYRFRVIIEGVFSAIKRKGLTYLRSKKDNAKDVEVLLKVLVYNLTIIGKYS